MKPFAEAFYKSNAWQRTRKAYIHKAFGLCESLLHSKSQRTSPLASNTGLLALVHITRLTGRYDYFSS